MHGAFGNGGDAMEKQLRRSGGWGKGWRGTVMRDRFPAVKTAQLSWLTRARLQTKTANIDSVSSRWKIFMEDPLCVKHSPSYTLCRTVTTSRAFLSWGYFQSSKIYATTHGFVLCQTNHLPQHVLLCLVLGQGWPREKLVDAKVPPCLCSEG